MEEASARLQKLMVSPYLENIPVQILRIGELSIIAYPAEIFCEIGLNIKETVRRTTLCPAVYTMPGGLYHLEHLGHPPSENAVGEKNGRQDEQNEDGAQSIGRTDGS